MQTYAAGPQKFSVDTVAPILRRGVLLDIAGRRDCPRILKSRPSIWSAAAQAVEMRPGDVVLLRTGWAASGTMRRSSFRRAGPGPAEAGARWLSAAGYSPPVGYGGV